jgi:serpin B
MKAKIHRSRSQRLFLLVALFCVALLPKTMQACRIAATPSASLATIANANNAFGLKLYQALIHDKANQNQFFSPVSIFSALAMTSEGAAGNSLQIFRETLGLPNAATAREGLKEMFASLSSQNAPYALAVANAIWPEATAELQKEFVETVKNVYFGESKPLDFKGKAEASRKVINAWVEQQTRNRIKNLLPEGSIDASVSMVLTNAIYFKGKWKSEFDKTLTSKQPFKLEDGTDVQADLMHLPHGQGKLKYAEVNGAQWVQLPYQGDDLSMVILLPKGKKITQLEQKFDVAQWENARKQLQLADVNVWLPKFKMEIGGSIKTQLGQVGMAPLFGASDFSRMFAQGGDFYISDVFHKAFVEVNEEGTEAAAATAVVVKECSAMPHDEPVIYNFRADHPFMFMIQQNATGNILFMGKVMNPTK